MISCKLYLLQPFLDHRILVGVPIPRDEDIQFLGLGKGTKVEFRWSSTKLLPRVNNPDSRFSRKAFIRLRLGVVLLGGKWVERM